MPTKWDFSLILTTSCPLASKSPSAAALSRRRPVSPCRLRRGVNGRQRGTSRREDALDTVIALRRPDDYSPKEGARFEVHLEKARALVGEGALPFEAVVEPLASESRKPGAQWVARDLKPPIFNQAAELFASGSTVREVKELLGISHGEAGRLRLRAAADGLLEASGQEEMRRRLKSPLAGVSGRIERVPVSPALWPKSWDKDERHPKPKEKPRLNGCRG